MNTFRFLNSRWTLAAALVGLTVVALVGCKQAGDASAPATTGAAFVLNGTQKRDVTTGDLGVAEKTRTTGVVSPDKKTLTFSSSTIRLVVRTGPENDMLSYRIQGLRNPALSVPKGAMLKVLFVNSDEDMRHDMRFGNQKAPFPSTPGEDNTAGSRRLNPLRKGGFSAEDMTLRAPVVAGNYTYFCSVRGHAQGGMWGSLIIG